VIRLEDLKKARGEQASQNSTYRSLEKQVPKIHLTLRIEGSDVSEGDWSNMDAWYLRNDTFREIVPIRFKEIGVEILDLIGQFGKIATQEDHYSGSSGYKFEIPFEYEGDFKALTERVEKTFVEAMKKRCGDAWSETEDPTEKGIYVYVTGVYGNDDDGEDTD
jgi:hypothetical protein